MPTSVKDRFNNVYEPVIFFVKDTGKYYNYDYYFNLDPLREAHKTDFKIDLPLYLSEEEYGKLLSMQGARAAGSRDLLAIAREERVAGEAEVAKASEEEIKPEPAREMPKVAAKPTEAEKAEEKKPRDKRAEELARLWEEKRSAEVAEQEVKTHPEKVPAPEEKPTEAEEKVWTLVEIQGKIGKEPSPLTQGPEAQEAWISKLGKLGVDLEEYRRLEAAARPKPVANILRKNTIPNSLTMSLRS